MTTGVIASPPILQFTLNNGQLAVNGSILTQVGGVNTATYSDSGLTTPLPNPIPLNSRGEVSDATGNSKQLFLTPNVIYTFTLYDGPNGTGNQIWQAAYVNGIQQVTQAIIGALLWPQTAVELAASVTPSNYAYPPGDCRRYGVVGNGSTDDSVALSRALSVQQDVFIPAGLNVLVTSGVSLQWDGQTLYGSGWDSQITCNGTAINAVTLSGRTRGTVRDLFIAYTGTATSGLNGSAVFIGSSSNYCMVSRCRLQAIRGGVTINTGTNSWVLDNLIDLVNPPDVGWDIAVYLAGAHNIISRNKCFGGVGGAGTGTTGISIQSGTGLGCDWNIVAENEVGTHSQYGIIVYAGAGGASAQHNTITANIVHDITGTYNSGGGNVFGTGIYVQAAEWTTVTANFIYNTNVSTNTQTLAPGAIGVNGTSCFSIVGNVIRAPVWFGIYIASDGNGSGGGVVEGNVITSAGKDGIFVSTISNVTVIGNTVFGSTVNGITYSNASLGAGICIQGNKVKNCGNVGINLIGQQQCPNVNGNYVAACLNGLIMQNCVGGIVVGNEFRNNTSTDSFWDNTNSGLIHFDRNVVRGSGAGGVNDSIGLCYGINDVAGQTSPYTGSIPYERVLATSATPTVAGSLSASYGGATAITDLLGGYAGQRVTIRATGAITLNHNAGTSSTKLINRAGANLSLTSGQTVTYELAPGGPWYQVN